MAKSLQGVTELRAGVYVFFDLFQAIDCGYGLVLRVEDGKLIPGLQVVAANQEHGIIDLPEGFGFEQYPVGSQLRILPNHACMTAAAHGHYNVVDGNDILIGGWDRCNGW